MKKLSSLLFAVLVSTMMFGQVSIDLNVIGRVDANPRFHFDGEKPSFNWANSSVYTEFEATFGEKFSLTMINHWAGSEEEERPLIPFGNTPALYKNLGTTGSSWLDYLYFDYMPNERFSLRVGKDCVAYGGFEYDAWDWDCDFDLCSTMWRYSDSYQWGASIAWANESQNTEFRLQALSSPYNYDKNGVNRPWWNGLGSYFFQHNGEYGIVEMRNAVGFTMTQKNSGYLNLGLGVKVNIMEGLSANVDFQEFYEIKQRANMLHVLGNVKYEAPSEKWEIMGKFGYENGWNAAEEMEGFDPHNFFGGVTAAYFPLRDKKDLRLQATLAYNPYTDYCMGRGKALSLTVGVTYNLPIHIL